MALAIVPGYALASLLRPRAPRGERLAFAIPCAYTLVALSGLATALLHLPYSLPAYAVPALPVMLAGAYAGWRRNHATEAAGFEPARLCRLEADGCSEPLQAKSSDSASPLDPLAGGTRGQVTEL